MRGEGCRFACSQPWGDGEQEAELPCRGCISPRLSFPSCSSGNWGPRPRVLLGLEVVPTCGIPPHSSSNWSKSQVPEMLASLLESRLSVQHRSLVSGP